MVRDLAADLRRAGRADRRHAARLVDSRRWIGQRRFLHALNYCMLLPGPEAQQLSIYIGWLLGGVRGGLIAGTLFVLHGMLALLALSVIYVAYGDTALISALFAGIAAAVVAIVAQAVHRVGSRALTHPAPVAIAVASFVALTVFAVPFPAAHPRRRRPGLAARPIQRQRQTQHRRWARRRRL